MRRPVTLILTHPFDPTADYVVMELNRRGVPVFRCDPGEFPRRLSIAARMGAEGWAGSLRLPERRVSLADVGCVYYRRPTEFDLPKDMSEQVRRWSMAEARMGAGGVLSALPHWLNHPADISRAGYKPVQLAHAAACGLQVAKMLTACRINDGMRVLEIGTGTGWNAALLARRLGNDRVVTVEIDHQLAERARKALAEMGLHPRVVAGDGELGWPPGSPYDRVLSTCTVHHIPYPWVEQTAPGGLIITPWRDPFCHQGKLLRLQVGDDGTAAGRFIDWASFMRSRTQRVPDEEVPTSGGEQSTTDLHPGFPLDGEHAETAIGATVSNCQWWREDLDGDRFEVRLDDVTSRSWASVGPLDGDTPAPYPVRQGGRRRLWDEVVAAYRWWEESGNPEYTRFGVTASRDRQLVWLAS